jgi:hypothetical protein
VLARTKIERTCFDDMIIAVMHFLRVLIIVKCRENRTDAFATARLSNKQQLNILNFKNLSSDQRRIAREQAMMYQYDHIQKKDHSRIS